MKTYVVSGSASGIGAALSQRLRTDGHTVIGVDLHDAEVTGDLATESGRTAAVQAVGDFTDGNADGQLATLTLVQAGFSGASITFSVTKRAPGGDGLAHVGFINASVSALIRWRVSGVNGTCSVTKSDSRNNVSRSTFRTSSSANRASLT